MQLIEYPIDAKQLSDAEKERLENLYLKLRGIFDKKKVVIITAKAPPERITGIEQGFDYEIITKPTPNSSFLTFTRGKERK